MKGNFYFEKAYSHHGCYSVEDGERIRSVIERSNKVILCLNGHAHWNTYHCIDGIHYITLPSLTVNNEIQLQVFGNLPIQYRLPLKQLGSNHWLNIDKDYAPQVTTPQ